MTFARTPICARLGVGLCLCLGLAAGILLLGNTGLLAQASHTSETSASWLQEQWPFPIDQWGTGEAFRCAADRCSRELHVYVRAKIGFCRCATGVADDDEIERVGDLELIGDDYKPLAAGHSVTAGIMTGRARLFMVARPLQPPLPILTIALAHKCDAIVATLAADPETEPQAEAEALSFLRSAAIQHWVEAQGGSP